MWNCECQRNVKFWDVLKISNIPGFKNLSPGQLWGAANHADIIEF